LTTIAANRKRMAGDTLVDDNGSIYHASKVFRFGDALVGVAGSAAYTTKFLQWFRQECPSTGDLMCSSVDDEKYDFAALVLRPDGLYRYLDLCEPDKLHDSFAALGVGAQGALVAMDMGASPAEAVRRVMKQSIHTGGRVEEMELIPRRHVKSLARKRIDVEPVINPSTT